MLGISGALWALRGELLSKLMFHDDEQRALVHTVGSAAAQRVPLEVTLAALADEPDDRRLAKVAGKLSAELARGATIEEALAGLGRRMPTALTGLLRAGVESGDLAGTFDKFAQQRMASQRVGRRIRIALAYPLLIVSILVPLLLFLSIYVLPMFEAIYKEMALVLPELTQAILKTSKQVPALIGGLLVIVLVIPLALRLIGGRWLFHRMRSAIPVVGRLWMWSGQREFAALVASFLELRLPVTSAVRHAGQMLSDRSVAAACPRVVRRLENGESLSSALDQSIHFDHLLVRLAAWGESHGVLPEALRIAVELIDDQIEQYASFLRRLLPPLTLIVVATLVFYVVIAFFVPLITIIRGLSKF